MGVIIDVIFTIAVVAVTTGAVTEFQVGVGYIGTTANGATVGISGFCGPFGKGNRSCLLPGRRFFAGESVKEREQIQNIFSCKQQIIQ